MTSKVEKAELLNVLEAIRREQYPDIPAELISSIVDAQFEKQDNREQARKDTRDLVDAFLATITPEQEG